ncbi:MAG: Cysteine desulfurase NifS [Parcubacteria group bacterium GW2011_GWA2_49_9]|nr:MAG: Cysteine desulfurase NifS [Parcubacteria group bacterium GW2011_GWA2_49_9]
MSRRRIYLDYASTTPLDPRVLKAMEPFFAKTFGNPSSIHAEGAAAKKALDTARTTVARCLEAHAEEIVFTSGGTESNNLVIFGVLQSPLLKGALPSSAGGLLQPPPRRLGTPFIKGDKPHIVTTNIEHSSILEPLRELERQGKAEVTYVPVEANGIVKPEKILSAIKPNTVLVSVMYANNEIGTVQPIRKIGQMLKAHHLKISKSQNFKILFHVDGCQAPLYLRCFVNALGVDLLTLDGHKIYGPKGVGALYVRRHTPLTPLLLGGGQERGLRSMTENIPAIVGFAEALRIATAEREKESARVAKLRDHLCADILENTSIENVVVNGSMEEGERLPSNLNISLLGVDTEFLTLQLDAAGIAVSTKSSCLKDEKESYVVAALGGSAKRATSSLRFTLGRSIKESHIEYCADTLGKLLRKVA